MENSKRDGEGCDGDGWEGRSPDVHKHAAEN